MAWALQNLRSFRVRFCREYIFRLNVKKLGLHAWFIISAENEDIVEGGGQTQRRFAGMVGLFCFHIQWVWLRLK